MDQIAETPVAKKNSSSTPVQGALPIDALSPHAEPSEAAQAAPGEDAAERKTAQEVSAESEAIEPAQGEEQGPETVLDRRRIEEQLEALKRKESELRRALAIADHPELEDAIRTIEGCTYGVCRVEAKAAQGLSKSEERRCETIDKKLSALRVKREELDGQIKELEAELFALTDERKRALDAERREAMERLIAALGQHEGALRAVGLDSVSLIPDLTRLMPEVAQMAEVLVSGRAKGKR